MLLLIDAGNTRIKWALAALPQADPGGGVDRGGAHGTAERNHGVDHHDRASADHGVASAGAIGPGEWIDSGAVLHDAVESLAPAWGALPVSRVLIANVAGATVAAAILRQLALQQAQRRAADVAAASEQSVHWFASTAQVAGIRNGYRWPERLGCDRLAALVGARALLPNRPLVVAVCGTATTVDALTATGDFIGGMILPGPGLMAASLARNTAQLPVIAAMAGGSDMAAGSTSGITLFADNTDDAIISGCLSAQAGAIASAVAAHGGAHCVISGGAAHLVAPRLEIAATAVDNLVLIGLQVVAGIGQQRILKGLQ